jgi:elongation factor P
MISTNDLKNGITIEYEGNIYVVMETQHVKPGKGAAIVKAKLKNLRTGAIFEQTFNAGVKVATARIEKQLMQYLYNMNDVFYFMNMESYEQLEIPAESITDEAKFLKENLEVYITSYEGEITADVDYDIENESKDYELQLHPLLNMSCLILSKESFCFLKFS